MAGQTEKWTTVQLLIIFCLLSLSTGFEVAEEQWKEPSPDVAALHHLRRPSEHMWMNSSDSRFDAERNPLSFLQECGNFPACVLTKQQDLGSHLVDIEKENRPQRAVDHSSQYDHQQIIMLQKDETVRKAATYLYEKHPAVSSVYVLDNNQRPKLVAGKSEPLSENSRLVLVGHGAGDASGEMRLSGYRAQDVAKIIQSTSRVSDRIRTTRVVACEVGSDQGFIESVLKELHGAGVETELHLWNSAVQVTEKGQIITEEVSGDGLQWRYQDSSKKVVATIDRNGEVTRRHGSGSKGEIILTKERNMLMPPKKAAQGDAQAASKDQSKKYREKWPKAPKIFIDPEVYRIIDQNKFSLSAEEMKPTFKQLEGLTWGMFYSEEPKPQKVETNSLQNIGHNYVIGKREKKTAAKAGDEEYTISWLNTQKDLKDVLDNCYNINSGIETRRIIRHYGKDGEDKVPYMMVSDWIFYVEPVRLYVYVVGKHLDNNEVGKDAKIADVKNLIQENNKKDKESYGSLKSNLDINARKSYPFFVRNMFNGEHTARDLFQSWYFSASVIAESARNFRTFPLTLMVLNMDENHKEGAWKILFDNHPMARGGSWIDENLRGFRGSAAPDVSSTTSIETQLGHLKEVLELELEIFQQWKKSDPQTQVQDRMAQLITNYNIFEADAQFETDYANFMREATENTQTPPGSPGKPSTSGAAKKP